MRKDRSGEAKTGKNSMSKTLVANWFGGEFGWLLMAWIPAVRHLSRQYDKTVVICSPEHDYLYKDFASKIEHYHKGGRGDRWRYEGGDPKIVQQIVGMYPGAKVITPNEESCTKFKREYFAYGQEDPEAGEYFPIAIHARAETKYGSQDRNWPTQSYIKLLEKLGNPKAASIGTNAGYIPGTVDLRGIPIERLCGILSVAGVCIGPSSGPMHLAHLCRCPILVWTGKEHQKIIKGSNRDRYERIWRPFTDVPVTVVDREGWHPKVETIAKEIDT
jgi:hypothetical protein